MAYDPKKTAGKAVIAFLLSGASVGLASALAVWVEPQALSELLRILGVNPLVVAGIVPLIHAGSSALLNYLKHRGSKAE